MKNLCFFNVLPTPQFAYQTSLWFHLFSKLLPFSSPREPKSSQILPRVIRELSPGAQILLTDPQKSRKSSPGKPQESCKSTQGTRKCRSKLQISQKSSPGDPRDPPISLSVCSLSSKFLKSLESSRLFQSSNPAIILPSCHHATMHHNIISSYHYMIISSSCHHPIIASRYHIITSSNHHVIKSPCHHIITSSYQHSYHSIIKSFQSF